MRNLVTINIKPMQLLMFAWVSFFYSWSYAQGPAQLAKADRKLWPHSLNSAAEFDYASKMEILSFAAALNKLKDNLNGEGLATHLKLSKVNQSSVDQWIEHTKKVLVENLNQISSEARTRTIALPSPLTWQDISEAALKLEQHTPAELMSWHKNSSDFYHKYLYEQLRLAALFPRIPSEILTLDRSERTGSVLKDKHFLLTFDDGPTQNNGHTDQLINTLGLYDLHGVFFVLGERLLSRVNSNDTESVSELYKNHLLASHGWVHKPHQKYQDWQQSIYKTDSLILQIYGSGSPYMKYFRPPYGQRNNAVVDYLKEINTTCMLWNIDSQDWNAKISADEISNRIITLMLLWRRGIILYHDIHSKANASIPSILESLEGAGIQWVDPMEEQTK